MAINYEAPIEIRDGRNGNWFWVDKEIWSDERLTASDKVIYGTLAYYANQKNQTSFPSIKSLEKSSGVSKRQVYYSIKRLEGFAHVLIERKYGKPNIYTLLDNGINHAKQRGAKIAPVQEVQLGGAKSALKGVQNNTTNNNIKTNKINEQDVNVEPQYFSNKKTNPLIISKGQQISYLKAFPTLSSIELKVEMDKCNNYMGMSSQVYSNPGLFLKKWLSRYMFEREQKRTNEKKLTQERKAAEELPEEERLKNIARLDKMREVLLQKTI